MIELTDAQSYALMFLLTILATYIGHRGIKRLK